VNESRQRDNNKTYFETVVAREQTYLQSLFWITYLFSFEIDHRHRHQSSTTTPKNSKEMEDGRWWEKKYVPLQKLGSSQ
jgi:hypothetical protein